MRHICYVEPDLRNVEIYHLVWHESYSPDFFSLVLELFVRHTTNYHVLSLIKLMYYML